MKKFRLLVDLGVITVPEDYVHATCIVQFKKRHPRGHFDFEKNITDADFPQPSHILKPGEVLRVCAFKQTTRRHLATLRECRDFLAPYSPIYVGVQGTVLVYEQKRRLLPKEYCYTSIDVDNCLLLNSAGNREVSALMVHLIDRRSLYHLFLAVPGAAWQDEFSLLCFTGVELGEVPMLK